MLNNAWRQKENMLVEMCVWFSTANEHEGTMNKSKTSQIVFVQLI